MYLFTDFYGNFSSVASHLCWSLTQFCSSLRRCFCRIRFPDIRNAPVPCLTLLLLHRKCTGPLLSFQAQHRKQGTWLLLGSSQNGQYARGIVKPSSCAYLLTHVGWLFDLLLFFLCCILADINECDSAPCSPGSSCLDRMNAYSCVCGPGITGERCQTSKERELRKCVLILLDTWGHEMLTMLPLCNVEYWHTQLLIACTASFLQDKTPFQKEAIKVSQFRSGDLFFSPFFLRLGLHISLHQRQASRMIPHTYHFNVILAR